MVRSRSISLTFSVASSPPRRNQAQPVQVVKVKAERSTHGCIRGVDGGEATVTMPLDHWNAGTGHRCDTLRHRVVLVAAVRKRDAAASHRSRSPAATSHHLVSLGCGLSRVLRPRPRSPKTIYHFSSKLEHTEETRGREMQDQRPYKIQNFNFSHFRYHEPP